MKRSTRWTTAIAATALLAVPNGARAQAPQSAPAEPAAPTTQNPPSAQPQTPPPTTPSEPSPNAPTASAPAASAQQVDPEAIKRHLTAARNSLSELTQLPAAGQLNGDVRTQISQLITNFNELITTNTEWRASYAKVQANLSTLIGDQRADESPAAQPAAPAGAEPAAPAGAAGAVGTSGTASLDPAIRSKLVEFRTHLADFEKAAGGGAPSASNNPASGAAPAASNAPTAAPAESAAAASAAASPAAPTASSTPSEPAPASNASTATGTSGRMAGTPGAVGTSGSASASPTPTDQPQSPPAQSRSGKPATAGQSEAMRHIEAIESILNGGSASATGTSGDRSKSATAGSTLGQAQIEEIKTHLTELRKAVNKEQ
jgi:hypothetical protein